MEEDFTDLAAFLHYGKRSIPVVLFELLALADAIIVPLLAYIHQYVLAVIVKIEDRYIDREIVNTGERIVEKEVLVPLAVRMEVPVNHAGRLR